MKSLVIGLIILSTCLKAYTQENSAVERLLEEADLALENSDFEKSLDKVQRAISQSPQNINALQKRIDIYYQMNEIKEASKLTDDAIRKFPTEPEFYYLRGLINMAKEKYYKALNDFNKVMDLDKPIELYKVHLNRGVTYLNLKDYDLAIEDLTKSIELNNANASAYHSKGMVYYELEDYSQAVDNFTRAIELSQDNPVTFFNLGMSYYRLEDKENACPYFHKACSLGDENGCRMALMECAKSLPK
jgi:tetratricopeptide (TPR) repeat protein